MVNIAAIEGNHDANVASTTPIERMSPAGFMLSMMSCIGHSYFNAMALQRHGQRKQPVDCLIV